jgi:predicted lipoprotein with Yx(FWY)xxD motif
MRTWRRATRPTALVLGAAAVVAGCGGGSGSSSDRGAGVTAATQTTSAPAAKNAPPQAHHPGPSVKAARSDYGRILFDGHGRALYLFTRDSGTRSRCYGACAAAWPPYIVKAAPAAGKSARASLLGTTRRRNGLTQATYAGHPLYFYVGDRKPGQVLCQDVAEFGGTWLVVSPRGTPVR